MRGAARPAPRRPSNATVARDGRPRACQGPSSNSPCSRSTRTRRPYPSTFCACHLDLRFTNFWRVPGFSGRRQVQFGRCALGRVSASSGSCEKFARVTQTSSTHSVTTQISSHFRQKATGLPLVVARARGCPYRALWVGVRLKCDDGAYGSRLRRWIAANSLEIKCGLGSGSGSDTRTSSGSEALRGFSSSSSSQSDDRDDCQP
jgi:hypothetical protein